ncbi:hypothetical protein FHG87_005450 [Trinorchestia longiramus]|nr:hypothetical protein FHG87_005450 [Trinorchestia longiramus]
MPLPFTWKDHCKNSGSQTVVRVPLVVHEGLPGGTLLDATEQDLQPPWPSGLRPVFCIGSLLHVERPRCEQGFLAFMTIKSKSRNRLDATELDFRCAVSKVKPRIDQLVEKKHIQPSH